MAPIGKPSDKPPRFETFGVPCDCPMCVSRRPRPPGQPDLTFAWLHEDLTGLRLEVRPLRSTGGKSAVLAIYREFPDLDDMLILEKDKLGDLIAYLQAIHNGG